MTFPVWHEIRNLLRIGFSIEDCTTEETIFLDKHWIDDLHRYPPGHWWGKVMGIMTDHLPVKIKKLLKDYDNELEDLAITNFKFLQSEIQHRNKIIQTFIEDLPDKKEFEKNNPSTPTGKASIFDGSMMIKVDTFNHPKNRVSKTPKAPVLLRLLM